MADIDLPVFSFRPNWREPLAERLAFLTDVLRAAQGAEQRRSLLETARRSYDADFLLSGAERTFWDLFMNRIGGLEVMAPLYWEVVTTKDVLTGGTTARIDFNTEYTEWPCFDGGLALVAGKTALDWEVVQIANVDIAGIGLAAPVVRDWPAGTTLYPLRRAVVDDFGNLEHKSAATAVVTARIRFVAGNPWTPAADPAPIYNGLPVLTEEPNWIDDLAVEMSREIALLDSGIGRTFQVDVLGRAFAGQAHRYFLPGRERMAKLRDLLYRCRGRAKGFWLPTFKADFKLAQAATSVATQLTVENTGFLYAGGQGPGREYIMIRHSAGTIFRRIIDVIPGTTPATEKLVLDSAVGLALQPGQVRKISFMDAARFDSDEFEIVHHAGLDGLHECNTTFRTFNNTRTAPLPIDFPIPAAAMTSNPCGVFEAHRYWRVRFLTNASDRFRIKDLEWRRFGTDLETAPCGSLSSCRSVIGASMLANDVLPGTYAQDVFIYGAGGDWSSNINPSVVPYIGYDWFGWPFYEARDYSSVAIRASAQTGAARTTLTSFAVDWSDDGTNWTESRVITTSGYWAPNELRSWDLY